MSYSFTALANNVVKCTGSGFFKAGPVPITSYTVASILNGTFDNPPGSGTTYTTGAGVKLLSNATLVWDPLTDYVRADSVFGFHRTVFSDANFAQNTYYEFKITNTANVEFRNSPLIFALNNQYNSVNAYQYNNPYRLQVSALGSALKISFYNENGVESSVNGVAGSALVPPGTSAYARLRRTSNDEFEIEYTHGAYTTTHKQPLSFWLSGISWSNLNFIFTERMTHALATSWSPTVEIKRV